MRAALRLLAPGVFAAGAALGIASTLAALIGTADPDVGYYRFLQADALSLLYGHGVYHYSAGSGYVPSTCPPVMPALLAGLDLVHVWAGWGVVISGAATAALAGVAARLAYRATGSGGPVALVRALGIGGLGVWLATGVFRVLYAPWVDPLAWSLAIAGMLLVVRAPRSARAAVAAGALMTAAVWTKPTTIVAAIAAALWLVAAASRNELSRRFVARFLTRLLA